MRDGVAVIHHVHVEALHAHTSASAFSQSCSCETCCSFVGYLLVGPSCGGLEFIQAHVAYRAASSPGSNPECRLRVFAASCN